MIISSQRFLDDETVAEKHAAKDYTVIVSPKFEYDGMTLQVLIDGHHSYAAAIADAVEPEFIEATVSQDDRIALLESSVEDYLATNRMDSDWYDVASGNDIW